MGDSTSAFYSVKLCVMINFSLRHNVFCFSFVVVLYSMSSLYAIIEVVLLNERDCHVYYQKNRSANVAKNLDPALFQL